MTTRWSKWVLVLLLLPIWVRASEETPAVSTNDLRTVILVAGLAGEEDYATEFNTWVEGWKKAVELAKAKWVAVGLPVVGEAEGSNSHGPSGENTDHDRDKLKKILGEEDKEGGELWLVLIGHGTFNGKEAKFNLHGPDVTALELAEWLKPFHRPLAFINCASASAPFINALSGSNRVVVGATRSGYEQNYARFGKYLAEGIGDLKADLDKDGQTSLLEAFISASKQAFDFYKNEGRLATEHALLDDNGDGFGTPADWFRGVRAQKKPAQGNSVDGLRAHQLHLLRSDEEQKLSPQARARRDELERSILRLREEKAQLADEEYYARLETLLLDIGKIYGLTTNAPKTEAIQAK
ncbi:MAG: hypothetical protein L0Z50_20235 [Verrucomicrobiales bacterium]|nr:hypothetical protein [Verrucomicrobiales bacterium]